MRSGPGRFQLFLVLWEIFKLYPVPRHNVGVGMAHEGGLGSWAMLILVVSYGLCSSPYRNIRVRIRFWVWICL